MILLVPCENLVEALQGLLDEGFFVVPAKAYLNEKKRDCLRITPMSLHTENDIVAFADSLGKHVVQRRNWRKI